jgi:soluble lytic murein transglycosylase-like protein
VRQALVQQDAFKAGISESLFVRQIDVESGFNPQAMSPSGAEGIAQFMPATAASLGIDPWNPTDALHGAAQLMARYTQTYGGDYTKTLAAYHAGQGALQEALRTCGTQWLRCLPTETQHYINEIM